MIKCFMPRNIELLVSVAFPQPMSVFSLMLANIPLFLCNLTLEKTNILTNLLLIALHYFRPQKRERYLHRLICFNWS